MPKVPQFATIDPADGMTESDPGRVQNLIAGSWADADRVREDIIDPMNGQKFLLVPGHAGSFAVYCWTKKLSQIRNA